MSKLSWFLFFLSKGSSLTKFGNTVSVKIEYGLNAKLRIVPVILSRGDNFICHFHGNLLDTIYYFAENSYSFQKIYYIHPLNLQRTIQMEGNKHYFSLLHIK